nr:hypothetical protein HEP85_00725 [Streptomyces sp. RPA4-2]
MRRLGAVGDGLREGAEVRIRLRVAPGGHQAGADPQRVVTDHRPPFVAVPRGRREFHVVPHLGEQAVLLERRGPGQRGAGQSAGRHGLHAQYGIAGRVGGLDAEPAVGPRPYPHAQHGRPGGMQRHPVPGVRPPQAVAVRRGRLDRRIHPGVQEQGPQHRVQQCRVQSEQGPLLTVVVGQRDLGEQLTVAPPHRPQLARHAVAGIGRQFLEGDAPGTRGRPHGQFTRVVGVGEAGREGAGRVAGPGPPGRAPAVPPGVHGHGTYALVA